jgi:hypothetical protein
MVLHALLEPGSGICSLQGHDPIHALDPSTLAHST